ncbi:signal peptide peptidase SppA [Hyalangium gracile]|uniref:signal peptide peptidase SppA n=1 Tax=Hyalangium gracile TaxID=394092 RepID=UPI001CCC7A94|nr:signal peptide peptidase SppA [Hyalangium gracile]
MLRLVFVAIANLLLLVRTLLGLPFRLLASRHRPTYVRFRLAGDPPYREQRKSRFKLGGSSPEPGTVSSLESFQEALGLLARDAHVKGILLELEGLEVASAKKDVLVKLLTDFRAAGKRVVGWAVSLDNLGYQVLCAADEVLLAPAGRLELVGYAAEATALGEGLSRVGIQAHFVRRGDYKTAPELFTHAHVSDIQRQTLEAFLDERYADLVDTVARGRKKTPEEVRALIDSGPYSAQRAVAAGLVDGVCGEADLPARLDERRRQEKDPDDAEEPIEPMSHWFSTQPFPQVKWRPMRRRPKLGLVKVSGMIIPGKGSGGMGPKTAGAESVVKALRQAGRDKRAKAVVLYIDSPGGSALASELILEAVQRVGRKKPVIAFVDQVCASGGYMAALGAKEIWTTPHAIIGSIGVFAGKFEASGLMERLGVRRTIIARGENSGIFSTSRGFTPHERASLEAEVEETYQAFLAHVAKARGRTKEEIHERAEGRVYSGTRALAAGLVDRAGSFEEACRHAMDLAKVPAGKFELALYSVGERRRSLLQLLLSMSSTHLYALCPTSWSLGRSSMRRDG